MPTPLDVFISYAHEDRALKDELIRHLSNLQRQNLIKMWDDGDLIAGSEWEQQVIKHLNTAHLILLLISADFMASDFCYSVEMQQAMVRHTANEARVIPILLRSTDWHGAPFSRLQLLPTSAKPVVNWPTHDDAFTDVTTDIRKAIEVMNAISVDSSPMPLWNVPYRRNPYFTGQETILKYLHTTLKSDKTTALTQPQAISGLGGIGKTQIALEYAHHHRQTYRAILWVQADTRDALISGFTNLARLLNLPQKDEQGQTIIVEAVKHWLDAHEQWLLILDNADDLSLLDEFLPSTSTGHILLTTRAQAQGTLAHGIDVEPMEAAEGALLLLRRAKVLPANAPLEQAREADRAAAREIVQELGGLPLAIDQAAAYIEETGCGLSGYLVRYRAERTTLLQRRGTLIKEHPEPVATTWSLSFAKVEEANPAAADLLRLCAFLHADAIPEEVLSSGASHFVPSLKILANSTTAFDKAITSLRAYCLVRRLPETSTLSMHRLVQAVLKDAMNKDQQHQWAERAVRSVNQLFPDVKFANWAQCDRYLLHALACKALIEAWNFTFLKAAHLLNQAGSYLHARGRYAEAEPLYQRALAIFEQQLGLDHPGTASSLNNLAVLYHTQGKYAEAEPLLKRTLAIREQQLGLDHPDTATSLNNLAMLYQAQGKYAEAEPLYHRALAIREQQLGQDHSHTAVSLNNLANLYQDQGKYGEAEPLYQRARAIYEQQLGTDHHNTATNLNNLAGLYKAQGKYGEAEPLYQDALAIYEQQLGNGHLYTATSLNNLAALYYTQEKYAEAESLYRRALAICEQQFGKDHPDTASSLNNLANLYQDQGKYGKAEPLLKRALAICEQQLGQDHPHTARTRNNYALLLKEMQEHR